MNNLYITEHYIKLTLMTSVIIIGAKFMAKRRTLKRAMATNAV